MGVFSIATEGMQQAQVQLEESATRVARMGPAKSEEGSSPVDTVDLSTEMVVQLEAKNQFSSNLAAVKTADETLKTAIDLLA